MNMFCAYSMKLVCFETTPTDVTPGGFVIITYEPRLNPALDPLHESFHNGLFIVIRHFISGFYSMPTRAQQYYWEITFVGESLLVFIWGVEGIVFVYSGSAPKNWQWRRRMNEDLLTLWQSCQPTIAQKPFADQTPPECTCNGRQTF